MSGSTAAIQPRQKQLVTLAPRSALRRLDAPALRSVFHGVQFWVVFLDFNFRSRRAFIISVINRAPDQCSGADDGYYVIIKGKEATERRRG